jgi:hypothetical protein
LWIKIKWLGPVQIGVFCARSGSPPRLSVRLLAALAHGAAGISTSGTWPVPVGAVR